MNETLWGCVFGLVLVLWVWGLRSGDVEVKRKGRNGRAEYLKALKRRR